MCKKFEALSKKFEKKETKFLELLYGCAACNKFFKCRDVTKPGLGEKYQPRITTRR